LGGAVLLDVAVLPWLIGRTWLPSIFLATLPLVFLFAGRTSLKVIFAAVLIYLRIVSAFNLGILFLALLTLAVYERWFLGNFFHKDAWQTTVFSGGGVIVFYLILFGLGYFLSPDNLIFNNGVLLNIVLTAGLSIIFSLSAKKFYPHEVF